MSYIEPHMKDSLKNHALEVVLESARIQSYYLKEPGKGRMMSTLITFTPEGIVLQGDLTPGRNGNVSSLGYGRGWFAGPLSGGYLCEKFLQKVFRPDLAKAAISREILRQRRENEIQDFIARMLWDGRPDGDEHDGRIFYDFWTDDLHQDGSDTFFLGYDPGEAGWLCAIQQRFAELWNARVAACLPGTEVSA